MPSEDRWFDKVSLSPSRRRISGLTPLQPSPLRLETKTRVPSSVPALFSTAYAGDKTQKLAPLNREAIERLRDDSAKAALAAAAASNARIREAANKQRAKRQAQKHADKRQNEINRRRRLLENCARRSPKE